MPAMKSAMWRLSQGSSAGSRAAQSLDDLACSVGGTRFFCAAVDALATHALHPHVLALLLGVCV